VVVTFDDGYRDNLHVAKPLLERYEVPATVFVASGYLGREFWWDQLDRILPRRATLPNQVSLTIGGIVHRLQEAGPRSTAAWRERSLAWLYRLLQPLTEEERQQVMEQIKAWSGITSPDFADQKLLSPDEVLRLGQGPLIEIGAHTVSHPDLTKLPTSEQETEIRQCKSYLEKLLNGPVTSFAYPHGSWSETTVNTVREAGYTCACTSLNDVVWNRSNCFRLPRFWAGDWDESMFGGWLNRWLND
jgi:peptidoglycan/xylan/chitin deacetylase (PgdA/CDA1 family)